MKLHSFRRRSRKYNREAGQSSFLVLLVLGTFLLGALGFAVDMGNLWFHRQAAQTAADAACVAGAMDLLVDAVDATGNQGGFSPGSGFDCATAKGYAPCQYAALNGYDSVTNNDVQGSFPASVPGVTNPPSNLAGAYPLFRIDIIDKAPTFFSQLVGAKSSQNVRAFAVCGLQLAKSPIPIIVLHPSMAGSLDVSGNPIISILGGAGRSIQVNSTNACAVESAKTCGLSGSSQINLECGGPKYTGSNLGVTGGPSTVSTTSGSCPGTPIPNTFPPTGKGFYPGVTGNWQNAAPINDPFAEIPAPTTIPPAPTVPADLTYGASGNACEVKGNKCTGLACTSADIQAGNCLVSYKTHGCPDPTATTPPKPGHGCQLFTAGNYPNGITVQNAVGIFDPGLYYANGGLGLQSNSLVRPGTGVGDGSQGTVFYLTGAAQKCSGQTGLVCVGSNSGKSGVDVFTTSNAACSGGPGLDPKLGVPSTLAGNVLLAPCTGTYGDPNGQYRGILFFADRSSGVGGGWGGGGGFLLAGSMYFHQCNASGTGTGCGNPPADYNDQFTLQGGSGLASYVLGEIITDQLSLGGGGQINMALNPSAAYNVLKVSLLQ